MVESDPTKSSNTLWYVIALFVHNTDAHRPLRSSDWWHEVKASKSTKLGSYWSLQFQASKQAAGCARFSAYIASDLPQVTGETEGYRESRMSWRQHFADEPGQVLLIL